MTYNLRLQRGPLLWQVVLGVVFLAASSPAQAVPDPLAQALSHKKSKQYAEGIRVLETAFDEQRVPKTEKARAHYILAWLYVATHNKGGAAAQFQVALRNGLSAKEAVEARAALRRLGVTIAREPVGTSSSRKPSAPLSAQRVPPRSATGSTPLSGTPRSTPSSSTPRVKPYVPHKLTAKEEAELAAMQARFRTMIEESRQRRHAEWIRGTVIFSVVTVVAWLLIGLLMSWAAQERFGKRDLMLVAGGLVTFLVLRCAANYLPQAGHYMLSFQYILPLMGAYITATAMFFVTSIGYGLRRVIKNIKVDKGGIAAWSLFYAIAFLVLISGKSPYLRVYIGLAVAYVLVWLARNPWLLVGRLAEHYKSQGNLRKAIELQEKMLQRRLSDKTRFVMLNDTSSAYANLGEPEKTIELASQAIEYAHAFKSAEVLPRCNLAASYSNLGYYTEAVEQCAAVFHLTETTPCFGGNALWKGAGHALLANINLRREWLDEAAVQADLCLKKFPPEVAGGTSQRDKIAIAKTVQAAVKLAQGQLEDAAKLCRQALKRKPKYSTAAFAHCTSASIFLAQQNYEEAESHCAQALAACERYPAAYYWQGLIRQAQGDEAGAQEAFAKAVEISPQHPYAQKARELLASPRSMEPLVFAPA